MKRLTILSTVAIVSGLGITTPLLAAGPPAVASVSQQSAVKPAETCMSDVRAFTAEMSKQGYWIGGSDYSYGYPMLGYGYGYGYGMGVGGHPMGGVGSYATARPGYDIRTLVASANILAQAGKKQACESVLAEARTLYTSYAADLHGRGISWTGQPNGEKQQIAEAQPVAGKDTAFRYDQLINADVVNSGDVSLGSVQDLVMDPQTGKIAYVVISRGGLFGIDASHTPVPWSAFKASPNGSLLVLDTTKAILAAAPQGRGDQFTKTGQFDAESQKVDTYWTAHVKLVSDKG